MRWGCGEECWGSNLGNPVRKGEARAKTQASSRCEFEDFVGHVEVLDVLEDGGGFTLPWICRKPPRSLKILRSGKSVSPKLTRVM